MGSDTIFSCYDAAGNLLDDGQRSYAWDAEQRLIRIGYTGTNKSTEFRYDGLSRRTSVREYTGAWNYTETRYLWCGERICQARNGSDTPIRRYYDEGEQLVTPNGTTSYYYAQDHLGSVRDITDAIGRVMASYDYDPYGNPTRATQSGSARADYRYAGLFYHAPSGLYLTRYRVYDPVTARWLSRDPIGEAGGINLYGYVGGDPVNYLDPLGLLGFGGMPPGYSGGPGQNTYYSGKPWKLPQGPFGPVCGSGATAHWIPDGPWKDACQRHDDCYSKCGASRFQCDVAFLLDSGNSVYFIAIRLGGKEPFDEARKKCCSQSE